MRVPLPLPRCWKRRVSYEAPAIAYCSQLHTVSPRTTDREAHACMAAGRMHADRGRGTWSWVTTDERATVDVPATDATVPSPVQQPSSAICEWECVRACMLAHASVESMAFSDTSWWCGACCLCDLPREIGNRALPRRRFQVGLLSPDLLRFDPQERGGPEVRKPGE
jgi:hypothetical protein